MNGCYLLSFLHVVLMDMDVMYLDNTRIPEAEWMELYKTASQR